MRAALSGGAGVEEKHARNAVLEGSPPLLFHSPLPPGASYCLLDECDNQSILLSEPAACQRPLGVVLSSGPRAQNRAKNGSGEGGGLMENASTLGKTSSSSSLWPIS